MNRRFRFGLLGHNIAYTKSPLIFAMLAEIRNANIRFDVIDIAPDDLSSCIDPLKELDGFSVTTPFKESLLPYMDDLSDEAQIIGAINSVRVKNEKMRGHNTDAVGFIGPIREIGFGGGRILVLGMGGAARAVIYVLNSEYPRAEFSVCGRAPDRVAGFIEDIVKRLGIKAKPRGLTFEAMNSADEYDLIVNCTPVGGPGHVEECPLPDEFEFGGRPICYDLVYDPARTIFLGRAGRLGCKTIGGLSMLVRQAVESYTIWTEDDFDRDAVVGEILTRLGRATKGDNS